MELSTKKEILEEEQGLYDKNWFEKSRAMFLKKSQKQMIKQEQFNFFGEWKDTCLCEIYELFKFW